MLMDLEEAISNLSTGHPIPNDVWERSEQGIVDRISGSENLSYSAIRLLSDSQFDPHAKRIINAMLPYCLVDDSYDEIPLSRVQKHLVTIAKHLATDSEASIQALEVMSEQEISQIELILARGIAQDPDESYTLGNATASKSEIAEKVINQVLAIPEETTVELAGNSIKVSREAMRRFLMEKEFDSFEIPQIGYFTLRSSEFREIIARGVAQDAIFSYQAGTDWSLEQFPELWDILTEGVKKDTNYAGLAILKWSVVSDDLYKAAEVSKRFKEKYDALSAYDKPIWLRYMQRTSPADMEAVSTERFMEISYHNSLAENVGLREEFSADLPNWIRNTPSHFTGIMQGIYSQFITIPEENKTFWIGTAKRYGAEWLVDISPKDFEVIMKSIQLINGKDSPLNELYADQVVGDIREAKQISDQASNFAKLYDLKQHVDNDGFWRLYHIANQEDLRPTLARLSLDKFKLYVDVSAVEHENVSFYEEFVQVLQGEASPELDRHVRAVEKAKLTDTGDMYVNMGVEDYDQIGPEKLREAKKIWDNFMFRGHDEASCAEEEPLFFEAVTSYVRGDDRRFREYEIAHRIYGELEEDCKDFWVEIFKGGDVSGDDEILKLSISDITKANQAYKLAEDSFQRGLFWDNFYKVVDNGTIQQWSDSIIQRFSEIKEEDAIGGDTYREVFNGS